MVAYCERSRFNPFVSLSLPRLHFGLPLWFYTFALEITFTDCVYIDGHIGHILLGFLVPSSYPCPTHQTKVAIRQRNPTDLKCCVHILWFSYTVLLRPFTISCPFSVGRSILRMFFWQKGWRPRMVPATKDGGPVSGGCVQNCCRSHQRAI